MKAKRLILVFNGLVLLAFLFLLVFCAMPENSHTNEFILLLPVTALIFLPFLSAVLTLTYWKELQTGIKFFGILPLLTVLFLFSWIAWNIRNMN